MKVSVIDGGHGSFAAAVDMVEKGFDVVLWRRDGQALKELTQLKSIISKRQTP